MAEAQKMLQQYVCACAPILDLFEKMVPMAIQQAVSVSNQRKADTVNRLVGSLREATNLCNG